MFFNMIIEFILFGFVVLIFMGFICGIKNLYDGKTFDGRDVTREEREDNNE